MSEVTVNTSAKTNLLKIMASDLFLPSGVPHIKLYGVANSELAGDSPEFAKRFLELGIKYLRIPDERSNDLDKKAFAATARASYGPLSKPNSNLFDLLENIKSEKSTLINPLQRSETEKIAELKSEDLDIAVMMAISLKREEMIADLLINAKLFNTDSGIILKKYIKAGLLNDMLTKDKEADNLVGFFELINSITNQIDQSGASVLYGIGLDVVGKNIFRYLEELKTASFQPNRDREVPEIPEIEAI